MNNPESPVPSPKQNEAALFTAALERPPSERAAFLDGACHGNTPLRQRLEALLAAHEAPDSLPEPAEPVRTVKLNIPELPDEAVGQKIGRYKILERVGEGGCGVVYVAEQTEPVRRRVALKVIKLGMDTKQVVARFEAERQALAMMDHPNIAKVLDAGATETGRPYFVMELVRGIRITDYCDQAQLSTKDRLDLFIQVCHAIQHAHQKGIIHRDIKPSNILVTLHDGVPVPKVIDFGIAKATEGRLTDATVYTQLHQFIGTPAYMSPEQAEMSGLDIDTRSDIYSLGVLLYELLTGKTPFDGQALMSQGIDAMRKTIREKEPARPSTKLATLQGEELTTTAKRRSVETSKLAKLLRGDLDWIVMKCLEKDRTRRYDTANGLAADLKRHLHNEPVVACPPSAAYRFQKSFRRNKFAFAAASAVTAALIIGLGVSTWMFFKEKTARRRAVAAEQQAHIEANKSRQVAQFLKDMLNGVGPSVALGRDTKLLREIVDQTARRLDQDLQDQPAVEADLRATLGAVYFELGEYTNAAAMQRKALELRKKLFGTDHPDTANSLHDLGETLRSQGRQSEAEPVVREALAVRKRIFGHDHLDVARSFESLALVIYFSQRKTPEAEALLLEALGIKRKLLGNEHLEAAISLNHLGIVLNQRGRFAEAEATHREALGLRRKLLGAEHPDIAASIHHVAWSLSLEGKLAEAEALFREALAMRRKLLGDEHPNVGQTLLNLGNTLVSEGKSGEAERVLREALELNRKLWGSHHPRMVSPLNTLANVLRREGKLAEAEELYRQALAIDTTSFGDWLPLKTTLLGSLAGVLLDQGKRAEAEKMDAWMVKDFRAATERERKAAEGGNLAAANNLAWFLATFRDPQLRDGRSAVSFAEAAVAGTKRKNAVYLDTLAAAYAEAGEFEKAASVQKEAMGLLTNQNLQPSSAFRLGLYESNFPYHQGDYQKTDRGKP